MNLTLRDAIRRNSASGPHRWKQRANEETATAQLGHSNERAHPVKLYRAVTAFALGSILAVFVVAAWRSLAIPPLLFVKAGAPAEFTPFDLTNLVFWGNGDFQLVKWPDTNGAPITNRWFDQTINTNDAWYNNGDAGAGPTIQSNVINGRAVVRFTGADFFYMETNILAGVQQGEIWVVVKADADPAGANLGAMWYFGNTNAVGGAAAYPHILTAGRIQDNFLSSQLYYYLGDPGVVSNAFRIYGVLTRTNEMLVVFDGDLMQGGNKIWPGSITNASIGLNSSTVRFKGDIANIFVFNYLNTELNRSNIVGWLTNRYNLTIGTNVFAQTARDPGAFNVQTNAVLWTNGMFWHYCATNFNGLTNNAPVGGTGRFWTDQGPLANHATNATAAQQPLFMSNVFGTLPNGASASGVLFDGPNDRLFFLMALNLTATNDWTFLAVHMPTNITTARAIAAIGAAAGGGSDFRVNHNTENRVAMRTPGGTLLSSASGEFIPGSALNGTPVMNVWGRTNGVWWFWNNQQRAFSYGDSSQTNTSNVNFDCLGFSTDNIAGYSGWIYEAVCWTNRYINPRDIINQYRFYFKTNLTVLP